MVLMRLQKFLSTAGICSRRQAEIQIRNGIVRVNGEIITKLGTKVDSENDRVEVDGKRIRIKDRSVYIALNKPRGYISSCYHSGARIVLDLIDIPQRVYPVGRLDKDSTGLLILTNDGRLHQRLTHPSFDHEKEYEVTVADPLTDDSLRTMETGMPMDGTTTRPAKIKRISPNRFRIVLREGKNRQVRRMVKQVGNRVTRLKRIRISNIRLGRLAEGSWRHLTEREKKGLV
jgi:23S rRNA pseudouridine2605 synthase/23S rRNA pseudouridine2604 synthase